MGVVFVKQVLQCLDRLMQVHEKYDQETLLARIAEYKSSNVSSPLPATRVASSTTVRPWQVRQLSRPFFAFTFPWWLTFMTTSRRGRPKPKRKRKPKRRCNSSREKCLRPSYLIDSTVVRCRLPTTGSVLRSLMCLPPRSIASYFRPYGFHTLRVFAARRHCHPL